MELVLDCHDVGVDPRGGSTERPLRVTLEDVHPTDLNCDEVYDAIDVAAFCDHHKLELKEE